jgi:hypothetical protein
MSDVQMTWIKSVLERGQRLNLSSARFWLWQIKRLNGSLGNPAVKLSNPEVRGQYALAPLLVAYGLKARSFTE